MASGEHNPTPKERFAARLAEIMEKAAGRPLTAEERARAHQHAADAGARFDAAMREIQADE